MVQKKARNKDSGFEFDWFISLDWFLSLFGQASTDCCHVVVVLVEDDNVDGDFLI